MKLNKICSCCGKELTTKNTINKGVDDSYGFKVLYINCKNCDSTAIILTKANYTWLKANSKIT